MKRPQGIVLNSILVGRGVQMWMLWSRGDGHRLAPPPEFPINGSIIWPGSSFADTGATVADLVAETKRRQRTSRINCPGQDNEIGNKNTVTGSGPGRVD